jgi:hypothetical protein
MRVVDQTHVYEVFTIPECDYSGFYGTPYLAEGIAEMAVQVGQAQFAIIVEHEIWRA